MITSLQEIFYLLILTGAIGFIFTGFIKKPRDGYELIYKRNGFDWEDFKFAVLVTAPAVVLHELAHKFAAIAFGLTATFKIFWGGLGLAFFLKLIHSPFLIIAPGYVEISGTSLYTSTGAIIAFAGPAINLILLITAHSILTRAKHLTKTQAVALYLTKQINILLFIFNMLPIPPLDGSKVFFGLYKTISAFF